MLCPTKDQRQQELARGPAQGNMVPKASEAEPRRNSPFHRGPTKPAPALSTHGGGAHSVRQLLDTHTPRPLLEMTNHHRGTTPTPVSKAVLTKVAETTFKSKSTPMTSPARTPAAKGNEPQPTTKAHPSVIADSAEVQELREQLAYQIDENTNLLDHLVETKEELLEANCKLETMTAELEHVPSQLETARGQITLKNALLEAAKSQFEGVRAELEAAQRDITSKDEQLVTLAEVNTQFQAALAPSVTTEEQQVAFSRTQSTHDATKTELEIKTAALVSLRATVAEKEAQIEAQTSALEVQCSLTAEADEAVKAHAMTVTTLELKLESANAKVKAGAQKDQEIQRLKAKLEGQDKSLVKVNADLASLLDAAEKVTANRDEIDSQLKATHDENKRLKTILDSKTNQVSDLKNAIGAALPGIKGRSGILWDLYCYTFRRCTNSQGRQVVLAWVRADDPRLLKDGGSLYPVLSEDVVDGESADYIRMEVIVDRSLNECGHE